MGSGDKNSGRSVKREARRAKRENSWTTLEYEVASEQKI